MITSTAGMPALYRVWERQTGKTENTTNTKGFPDRLPQEQESYDSGGRFDVARCTRSTLLLGEPLLLPTERNIKELSADLSSGLSNFFREQGVASDPPVKLSVNADTGKISVEGDREDTQHIEELVNDSSEIRRLAQTINALSSHAYAMPRQMQFQQEYRASSDPLQVVAKYSSLFGSTRNHNFSLLFNGDSVQVLADEQSWITS